MSQPDEERQLGTEALLPVDTRPNGRPLYALTLQQEPPTNPQLAFVCFAEHRSSHFLVQLDVDTSREAVKEYPAVAPRGGMASQGKHSPFDGGNSGAAGDKGGCVGKRRPGLGGMGGSGAGEHQNAKVKHIGARQEQDSSLIKIDVFT